MPDESVSERSLLPGVFEGQYLDARGYRGKLKLEVQAKEDRIEGRYELIIATEDKPQTLTGSVQGSRDGAVIRLKLAAGRDSKEQRALEYVAELQSAGSYAKQCMFGSVIAPKESGLGGGVWIAWQFAGRRPDKPCGQR